jgi:hypothetical protein
MATTLADLTRFMDESGLKYEVHEEHSVIAVGFSSSPDDTTYRDGSGDPTIGIVIRVTEDGEFVATCAPGAWSLKDSAHIPAVCEAIARIQNRMKLIRFDLDDDGYLHPNIEIPLESAPMCATQLQRAITGILIVVKRFDAVICHARDTGVVDFDLETVERDESTTNIARILELADEAGGSIDAIERLLGGGGPLPTDG